MSPLPSAEDTFTLIKLGKEGFTSPLGVEYGEAGGSACFPEENRIFLM